MEFLRTEWPLAPLSARSKWRSSLQQPPSTGHKKARPLGVSLSLTLIYNLCADNSRAGSDLVPILALECKRKKLRNLFRSYQLCSLHLTGPIFARPAQRTQNTESRPGHGLAAAPCRGDPVCPPFCYRSSNLRHTTLSQSLGHNHIRRGEHREQSDSGRLSKNEIRELRLPKDLETNLDAYGLS